jgi:hypothetical protein
MITFRDHIQMIGRAVRKKRSRSEIFGAGEGVRTLDPDLGKVVLYH